MEVHYSSKKYDYGTPIDFFKKLDDIFHFTLDVCASHWNAKCERYFTPEVDGLKQDWKGEVCWCNPPYGRQIKHWVKKSAGEYYKGAKVVMLVPSRTDTTYFQNWGRRAPYFLFLKGRLKFDSEDGETEHVAPFPSMLLIYQYLVIPEQLVKLRELGLLLTHAYVPHVTYDFFNAKYGDHIVPVATFK